MSEIDHDGTRAYGRDRVLFCLATFLYWASLYLYVPILPVYAESATGSLSLAGVVIASYAVPQLLLRIPLGLRFDAVRRRKPLVVASLTMCLAGAIGLALAEDVWMLSLARAATGVGAAGWVAFTVFFVGYSPPSQGARAIGSINAVNQVALVVATGAGGLIAEALGYRATFIGAALLAVLGAVVLSLAREPIGESRVQSVPHYPLRSIATIPLLFAGSGLAVLLQFASFASVFGFVPVWGASIGASSGELGAITMVSLGAAAVAASVSVRLAERFGYSIALVVGALIMSGSLLLVPATETPVQLGLSQVATGLGRGTLSTLLMALAIRSAPAGARATAMGIYQAVYAIGMLAGPLASGFVAENLHLDAVFRISALLTLMIAVFARHPVVRRA
ncbi:MAG: MFS transporter [Dehalococcoidia bacterium]|nr:MFS transporter [Dehalococcoidia bacterium]